MGDMLQNGLDQMAVQSFCRQKIWTVQILVFPGNVTLQRKEISNGFSELLGNDFVPGFFSSCRSGMIHRRLETHEFKQLIVVCHLCK